MSLQDQETDFNSSSEGIEFARATRKAKQIAYLLEQIEASNVFTASEKVDARRKAERERTRLIYSPIDAIIDDKSPWDL